MCWRKSVFLSIVCRNLRIIPITIQRSAMFAFEQRRHDQIKEQTKIYGATKQINWSSNLYSHPAEGSLFQYTRRQVVHDVWFTYRIHSLETISCYLKPNYRFKTIKHCLLLYRKELGTSVNFPSGECFTLRHLKFQRVFNFPSRIKKKKK